MDRLDAMQVLLAVVDAGSLSAGSRKLSAPLPSVSRKVADLERHLGTRLLIRTSRNVQLTDAGRDYVDAARQIVAQIEDAELRASGEYETPRGSLTIAVPTSFGRNHVLPLAHEFLHEHPEITLNVLSVDRVVHFVEERVDVGVGWGRLSDNSLYAVKVGDVSILTCASPDYLARKGRPSSPEDLVDHDVATFDQFVNIAWPGWVYRANGRRIEAKPNVRFCASTTADAVNAAVRGIGITRAPSYQVAGHLRSGALVTILDEYASQSFPIHLVYIRQGLLPLKVRAFIDWMTPRLRKALKDLADVTPAENRPKG
ncbi:LysR family transcriptional regulator [Sphingomonas sp. JC676]|uniref:LysR family transcriptional regulator n=1 Tax=Sphingomonas sp. JC676 TaxID=2768065 RepID=UPI0016582ECC|nr:LysR family transcriptional regulator [Sphingomonas sp. JC676]MBC9034339.1 LysR family transcriptional regulator [Sphingomonas sp. JC676]